MKSIELLAIGIRVLGVAALIYVVQMVFFYYQQYQLVLTVQSGGEGGLWLLVSIALAHFGVLLAVAFLMLKFPVLVARWFLPKAKSDDTVFDGSANDIEVVAFVIIGIYILSWAIPDLFHNSIWWWYTANSEAGRPWGPDDEYEYIINGIVTVIEVVIGLFLCLRARGLSGLLRRLREAGGT